MPLKPATLWKDLSSPRPLPLIAGSCVIEAEDLCLRVASALARAEAAAGAHAPCLETHPDPDPAPGAGPNMIPSNAVPRLLGQLLRLRECLS